MGKSRLGRRGGNRRGVYVSVSEAAKPHNKSSHRHTRAFGDLCRMRASDLQRLDAQHIWHPFTPARDVAPILVERAQGAYLFTPEGRPILDAVSSWWVNLHGHAHPHISMAVARQAAELEQVIFAGFTHPQAIRLCHRLARRLPVGVSKFFFSDNGSTAVEVALKMVMHYFHNMGDPRTHFLCFREGYHGDTFGAMAVSGESVFHKPYRPLMFETAIVDLPADDSAADTLAQIDAHRNEHPVMGMILEPMVLGAGGFKMYSHKALSAIIKHLKANGLWVIADEVMTGFGRTGTWFAHEACAETPDIICLSKGLTGGYLPMGLTVVREALFDAFNNTDRSKAFLHGHSFTGSPLACAAANASLDILEEEDAWHNIRRIAKWASLLVNKLGAHPSYRNARSCGTIFAVEFGDAPNDYHNPIGPKLYKHFLNLGILLRPLGNTIYVLPPYCTSDADLCQIEAAILGLPSHPDFQ